MIYIEVNGNDVIRENLAGFHSQMHKLESLLQDKYKFEVKSAMVKAIFIYSFETDMDSKKFEKKLKKDLDSHFWKYVKVSWE